MVQHLLAAAVLRHGGQGLLRPLVHIGGGRRTLLLRQTGQQGVQGRSLECGVHQGVLQSLAVHLSIPGHLAHAEHTIILGGAVDAIGQPVQQAVGGDLRLSRRGHHRVTGQTGGGQIGVCDPGEVHRLHLGH